MELEPIFNVIGTDKAIPLSVPRVTYIELNSVLWFCIFAGSVVPLVAVCINAWIILLCIPLFILFVCTLGRRDAYTYRHIFRKEEATLYCNRIYVYGKYSGVTTLEHVSKITALSIIELGDQIDKYLQKYVEIETAKTEMNTKVADKLNTTLMKIKANKEINRMA